MINHCDIHITLLSDTDTVQSETFYHAMSLTTVLVSIGRVIRLSQWFIMLCLISVSTSLRSVIFLSQWLWYWYSSLRHSMINHFDRHITLLIDTDTVVRHSVINHCDRHITLPSDTDTWLLYQYHEEEWYVYHSDLSRYVSDYCISITKKSDVSQAW
jgi:hypothetical protein